MCKQRVVFTQGLVAHDDRHFVIAGGSGKLDEAALFQEAHDAYGRLFHDLFHLYLRGRCSGVKHRRAAVLVAHVNAIKEYGVKMRIAAQVARCTLNDGEASAFGLGGATCLGGAFAIEGGHSVCEEAVHGAQQARIERQGKAQHKGVGEHPLPKRHAGGQHVVNEICRAFVHAAAATAWAKAPAFAAKR